MEAAMVAGVLANPVAFAVLFGIAFCSVRICGSHFQPTPLSERRLWCALLGVAVAIAFVAAVASYASPEEARRFGVSEENRWSAIRSQFLVLCVLGLYGGVLGASFIGIPLALFMVRKRIATVPRYVLASLPFSVLFAGPFMLLPGAPDLLTFVACIVGSHALLAFGFAMGARLPWRNGVQDANAA